MKQDIRELFKEDVVINKLPDSHRRAFLKKLKKQSSQKRYRNIIGVVASFVLLFSLSFWFFKNEKKSKKMSSSLLLQVQKIEKKYLNDIDKEWGKFLELTEDEKLISVYEKKLNRLSNNYRELTNEFMNNSNNMNVLEKLITNLQQRLQTLKDIQNHIKSINQKNITYETIIL